MEQQKFGLNKALLLSRPLTQAFAVINDIPLIKRVVTVSGQALQKPQNVWSLLGMEYLYVDDFKNARLTFQKCIKADVEDYAALYNIVYCFDMEKEHKAAIVYLNSYIDVNPYCEVAWHQLGRQYFILEMYTEALSSFDYAVLIDESFVGGYLEKAKTLEQLNLWEDAIENYKITVELDDPTSFAFLRIEPFTVKSYPVLFVFVPFTT